MLVLAENNDALVKVMIDQEIFSIQTSLKENQAILMSLSGTLSLLSNSFTSQHVNNCASRAGAAAHAGVIEKDDRHDSMVTLSGGLFYPIVVETFGTWSPYSLEVIKTIARKMSLVSSLLISKIVCNIHEQLSVRLWQYNAKMVLDKLHLAYSDMDLDYI